MRHRLAAAVLSLCVTSCGGSPTAPGTGLRILAVSPAQGSTFGGTSLVITGSGFSSHNMVFIGGLPTTAVAVHSSTTITATTLPHVEGVADVSVSDGSATATLKGAFTFVRPGATNTSPIIVNAVAQGSRPNEPLGYADIGETISVAATVTDQETAVSQLTFRWTADRGTISGAGPSVLYTAPATPGPAVIRLEVIETYHTPQPTNGLPAPATNRSSAVVDIDVHDAPTEVGDMARDFLQLFSQSSVAPLTVMHNFQEGCGANGTGRADELQQVTNNRDLFVIQPNWFVGVPRVTIAFNGRSPYRARRGDAYAAVDVDWTSQCKKVNVDRGCPSAGYIRHDVGVDWLTARYDRPTRRWWLCDSDFEGRTNLTRPYLR